MCEEVPTHVLEHELAHLGDGHGPVPQKELVDHDGQQKDRTQGEEPDRILGGDDRVDHGLGHVGNGHGDGAHG